MAILKQYSSGSVKSQRQKAIEDKEFLMAKKERSEKDQISITKGECGLKNPCKFGRHNQNWKIEV